MLLYVFEVVKPGDTIVTTEVSRLTRSTKYLCDILQIIQDKHLVLNIGGSFLVDCSKGEMAPMTEGMIKMWGVFAETERNIISQRVKSGMANAKAKGKKIGRPQVTTDNLPPKFIQYYPMYKRKELSITDFAGILKCSRTTIINIFKL